MKTFKQKFNARLILSDDDIEFEYYLPTRQEVLDIFNKNPDFRKLVETFDLE